MTPTTPDWERIWVISLPGHEPTVTTSEKIAESRRRWKWNVVEIKHPELQK